MTGELTETNPARIDERILELYEELPQQQRRLADVVLQCAGELGSYTAVELARRAHVSKATAARLFQRLGYKRFEDARYAAAQVPWASPLRGLDNTLPPNKYDILGEHFAREMENLGRSNGNLDRRAVEQTIELLSERRVVWVAGFRISYAIARYLASVLGNVRPGVRWLADGVMEFAERFAEISTDDVVVIVAFRRRPPVVAQMVEAVSQISVPVVLLSDLSLASSAANQAVLLRCHMHGASIFDSHTVAFSLVNFLCCQVGVRAKMQTEEYINRIEQLHYTFKDVTSL